MRETDYEAILEAEPVYTDDQGRDVWDMDLIVRQLLVNIMNDRGWSQAQAAKKFGFSQKTLSRFLSGQQNTSLRKLSQIATGLETTPLRFLDSHPDLGRKRPAVRIVRDKVYDRFRSVFTPQEQDQLLTLIEEIRNLGLYAAAVSTLKGIVDAGKIGKRRGKREARKKVGG